MITARPHLASIFAFNSSNQLRTTPEQAVFAGLGEGEHLPVRLGDIAELDQAVALAARSWALKSAPDPRR